MLKKTLAAITAFMLLSTIAIGVAYAQSPPPGPFDIPLTVTRSADRLSATAVWTPDQGVEVQAFAVVAKLLPGEPDTTGYGVKADTFRYVDWPLAGNVGRLIITELDPARDYIYAVIGAYQDSEGNWVWGDEWEIVWNASPAPTPTATATSTPSVTPTSTTTPSATPTASATPTTIAQLVKNVQGGVVQILTITSSGSGFIIDTDGHVVTNQHVVGGNRSVTVRMNDGTEYPASVLGVDAVADLAVIDIAPEIALTPVPLGDSSKVQVGEDVVAIGYPLGYQLGQSQTVTTGIISSRRPNFQGSGVEHLQTDAAMNPGNSGGPLFNRAGQVIGVNTSRKETTSDGRPVIGISFAVSINELKSRLDALKGNPQPGATPTRVPTPATPAPTPSTAPTPLPLPAGWNRYRNGVYGFSVDTPPGWTVNRRYTGGRLRLSFRAPDRKGGHRGQSL